MCELGWKSLGVLELTALPSIKEENWIPEVQETDALLVWGGSPLYLCYWMRQSDWPTSCRRCAARRSTSAPAARPWSRLPTSEERATTTVIRSRAAIERWDWLISRCFHLEREDMPDTSLANIERWAAGIPVPAYAIDDQTAIKVTDGAVEVVSEGHWKLFSPDPEAKDVR